MEQSVIVVTDILGYSDMIQDAYQKDKQQDFLIKIHNALGKALKNVSDPSGSNWHMKLYSDNLIIGYRFLGAGQGAFELPQACHCIGHFQREMAVDGFFIRGGIAVGSIHISKNLIFGQVLEELKKAEGRANYPRVVFLDSAIDYLLAHPDIRDNSLLNDILWDDDCDGTRFINYLYPLRRKKYVQRETEIQSHKRHIESNLVTFKSNDKVCQKYKWLAKYHNRFCRKSGIYNAKTYIIAT